MRSVAYLIGAMTAADDELAEMPEKIFGYCVDNRFLKREARLEFYRGFYGPEREVIETSNGGIYAILHLEPDHPFHKRRS